MDKKLWTITAAVVAIIFVLGLWLAQYDQHDIEEEHDHDHAFVHMDDSQREKYGIAISEATSGTLKDTVQAPAMITIPSDQIAHVYPKAPGIVVAAYKNLGEEVKEGDLLATIESQEVAEAKSSYLAALKQEDLKRREFSREQKLSDKKISSEQEIAASQHAYEEAQIALELAKHKLYALGLSAQDIDAIHSAPSNKLSSYEVRAPISGKIIERNITKGALVKSDQEIYEIGDIAKVWAEVNVFPSDRKHIKPGQTVAIDSDENGSTQGNVLFLSPVIDSTTRTSKAIVVVDNADEQWLPGTFTNATIVTNEVPAIVTVNKEAIQNVEGNDCVFVMHEEGFELRPIIRGKEDRENVEVVSGLERGEKIASKNTFLLRAELLKDEAEHMD